MTTRTYYDAADGSRWRIQTSGSDDTCWHWDIYRRGGRDPVQRGEIGYPFETAAISAAMALIVEHVKRMETP